MASIKYCIDIDMRFSLLLARLLSCRLIIAYVGFYFYSFISEIFLYYYSKIIAIVVFSICVGVAIGTVQ